MRVGACVLEVLRSSLGTSSLHKEQSGEGRRRPLPPHGPLPWGLHVCRPQVPLPSALS